MSVSVYAQSADVITELLNADSATFGEVCYLSAVQQGLLEDSASYEDAVAVLGFKSQVGELVDANEPIKARDAAAIFAAMWDVKGGLMYRLSKGSPRYAFKQFQSDGVLPAAMDPSATMTGSEVLRMYTACVKKYSDFNIKNVSMEAE